MEWTSYGLAYGDVAVFEKLITDDSIFYGTGMASGRNPITRAAFLRMLTERIVSRPKCEGYVSPLGGDSNMLWVITAGWEPKWMDGRASADYINFTLVNDGEGFSVKNVYFDFNPIAIDSINAIPCPTVP
jgi:hypothetical protein